MRGLGRETICKDFRPDHRLGIWDTHNLAEERKERKVWWGEEDLQRV
jgi:hypothetical protein